MGAIRHALIAALAASCLTSAAFGGDYPDKPIKVIVPIAAGSVTDVIMRNVANELQPRLGQTILIENRPGANGIVGAHACTTAAPDGYTICAIYHQTTSYNPLLYTKLPYDAQADFTPIARMFFLIEGIFVNASLGINTVEDLRKYVAAKPDSLNFASLGEGSSPDLFLRWLNDKWKSKIVNVSYKGGGPAAQAVAANEVQLTRFGIGNFLGVLDAKQVKVIAVTSAKRSPLLPEVPTFDEVGWGDYPGQGWWGLAGPKGMPPAVLDRLNKEIVKLFSEPKFVSFLDHQFVVPAADSPADFIRFLQQDRKDADALMKIAKIKPVDP